MDKEIPINPNYKISFGKAIARFWTGYFKFSGRATRAEFLFAGLFYVICSIAVGPATGGIGGVVWEVATVFPWTALWVRRLHDIGQSGWVLFWHMFLGLVCVVTGAIATVATHEIFFLLFFCVFAFCCFFAYVIFIAIFKDSQKGKNKFGDSEKYPEEPVPAKTAEKAEPPIPATNSATKFCPHCGNKVPQGSSFCPQCGGKQPQL